MNAIAAALILLAALASPVGRAKETPPPRTHLELTLVAKDGAQVPAKFWTVADPSPTRGAQNVEVDRTDANRGNETKAKERSIILAFHQAGASSAEYLPIAPELVALGYDVLAIDQRVGGNAFGGKNVAAAKYAKAWRKQARSTSPTKATGKLAKGQLQAAKGPPYLDAWPDLVAALDWAQAQRYRDIVLWGSSYSAALVIKLGAARPHVRAVLAFSPGEYLKRGLGGGDDVVTKAASVYPRFRGSPPVLVVAPPKERERTKSIVAALGRKGSAFYPAGGVHGSSTLVLNRCAVASTVWPMVKRFLRETRGRR